MTAIRDYGEIGPAVATSATDDPLFPGSAAGAEATACMLVAWAWEATRFQKNAAPSPAMGLYALRPPRDARVRGDLLTVVRTASLVAIDRMRDGMRLTEGRAWYERIAPFVAECRGARGPTKDVVETSLRVSSLAETLLARHYLRKKGDTTGRLLLGR